MDDLPGPARVMVVSVVLLGVGLAMFTLPQGDLLVVLTYLSLGAVLQSLRVQAPRNIVFSVTILVIFLGMILHGAPGIVAASIGAGMGTLVAGPRISVVKSVYNAGQHVICGVVASAVFLWAGGEVGSSDVVEQVIPVLIAVVAYSLLNMFMLSSILAATKVLRLGDLPTLALHVLVLQTLYSLFSLVGAALVAATNPLFLVLALIPMLLVRNAWQAASEELDTFDRLARTFAKAIEVKDGYTGGHGERVADLSVRVARELRVPARELTTIRYAALLHDVGKIGVSLGVLCKNGRLDETEYDEMKIHPTLGADLLRGVDFLDDCLPIVRHHHERLDGRGYPDGLPAQDIPMLTRIVTAVDAFDAMTSTRSYRRAMPVTAAMAELRAHSGSQFDVAAVEALAAVVERDGWTLTDERVQVVESNLQPRSVT